MPRSYDLVNTEYDTEISGTSPKPEEETWSDLSKKSYRSAGHPRLNAGIAI